MECPNCKRNFEFNILDNLEDNFYSCPYCRFIWNIVDFGKRIVLIGWLPNGTPVRKTIKDYTGQESEK